MILKEIIINKTYLSVCLFAGFRKWYCPLVVFITLGDVALVGPTGIMTRSMTHTHAHIHARTHTHTRTHVHPRKELAQKSN